MEKDNPKTVMRSKQFKKKKKRENFDFLLLWKNRKKIYNT